MQPGVAKSLAVPALLCASAAAQAHGFGQRFDLPLPLWLWLTGAGATLVLTFLALALFARERDFGTGFLRSVDLLRYPPVRRVAHPLAVVLRMLTGALFVLTVATGFFGNPDAYANLSVTMVWVLWWVGMAFFCALVGDLWEVVNPLPTLYRAVGGKSLGWTYPARLAAWPSVALFFAFAWAELIWQDKDVPRAIATALLAYAALSWVGMLLFGVEPWRRHADAFAMVFRVLGRFAPLEIRSSPTTGRAHLSLRPYAAGLLANEPVSNSVTAFVLLMLATVTFDGFHETPLMDRIGTAAQTSRPVAETLFTLSTVTGMDETQWLNTVVLLLFPIAFVLIFRGVGAWMLRLAGHAAAGRQANADVNAMVWSLVPIAVAYHLAHYASLLLTTGQFIIPLASDPFGWGWNLFGTRGRTVDLGIVSPAVYWYVAVTLIVIGHVLAVIVAHMEASRRFASHRAVLMSQLPMLVLMVAYTSLSLWIMAQPIVG